MKTLMLILLTVSFVLSFSLITGCASVMSNVPMPHNLAAAGAKPDIYAHFSLQQIFVEDSTDEDMTDPAVVTAR